ncbi:hypothetical protein [Rhodococcus sp. JS3073]|uniref:hypothetical protein n=1 Tax=Rhodococcus sp. JS3073 TaxID=3002901 RepID=UPI002286876D|nr:hypothetical protein [Rhodococcus sp. JS3073]WAM13941.1 hypothetical protein OYT95_31645 [Rhodococcus sp. JS3073]
MKLLKWSKAKRELTVQALLDSWMNHRFPLDVHPAEWWLERFRALGYSSDGRVGEKLRPAGSLVLCRGAVESARHGLSWTPDLALGRWFAERCGGEVWVAEFAPERLLAHLGPRWGDQQVEGGTEYLADPTGLTLVRLEDIPITE